MKKQMLEAGRDVVNAVFATVKFIKWGLNYGFVTLEDKVTDIWFHTDDLCGVIPGDGQPRLVDVDELPKFVDGTRVMIMEPKQGYRGLVTDGVCRRDFYDDAEKVIASRPYYRVWHSTAQWDNGKFIPMGDQPYAEGSLKALCAHVRGSEGDPLSAGYKTGPITVKAVKWERRTPTGGWEVCKDPRPIPAHLLVTIRVMKDEAGKLRQVWTGPTHSLIELAGFKTLDFHFEQARKSPTSDEVVWAEIADPRAPKVVTPKIEAKAEAKTPVAPARKKAEKPGQPTTAKVTKSVAMPKSDKPKPTVVKGLDALTLAPVAN